MSRPTIDILISTINEGIYRIPDMLLPPMEGVRYVVSHQVERMVSIPPVLENRDDVEIYALKGRGLSRNRNNALKYAKGDICVIADDDNQYCCSYLDNIISTYQAHPEADIICFRAETYDGCPMKKYPEGEMTVWEAMKKGYYLSSIEMTMKRVSVQSKIAFNTNFGLGAPRLCAGEEDIFMADARKCGLVCLFVDKTIVRSDPSTTGDSFLSNPRLQTTKGVVFRYCYGYADAVWRSLKEAMWWMRHRGANPFPIFYRLLRGINLSLKS